MASISAHRAIGYLVNTKFIFATRHNSCYKHRDSRDLPYSTRKLTSARIARQFRGNSFHWAQNKPERIESHANLRAKVEGQTRASLLRAPAPVALRRHRPALCYGGPLSPIPAFTLTPQYWAPGQSNIPITVTSNPGSFVAYTPPPYDVPDTAYILTQASYYAEDWFTEDPNVTVTLPVYVSPTEITFSATVLSSAPTEPDAFTLPCVGHTGIALSPGTVEITPCATPVIPTFTSMQPSYLFQDATTTVTITGSGFILPNNANNCAPTLFYGTVGGVNVPISNVTVVSPTQITAVVGPLTTTSADPATRFIQAVQPNESAESGTFSVQNYLYNSPLAPAIATKTAQFVPTPTIDWNATAISGTGASTQTAVVGQQIMLTIDPTTLPAGITGTTNEWNAGAAGTNVGGYAPTPGPTTAPSPTALTGAGLTTYWIKSAKNLPVTYSYCANFPDASYQCSPTAKANFNVNAPTKVKVYTCGGAVNAPGCSGNGNLGKVNVGLRPDLGSGHYLSFGGTPETNIGIAFTSGDDVSSPAGLYSFAQLIVKYTWTYSYSSGTPCTSGLIAGLDTIYPYTPQVTMTTAEDNPGLALFPDDTGVTTSFQATMYAFWTPSNVPGTSIPVPLGNLTWGWNGNAVQKNAVWSLSSGSGSNGQLVTTSAAPNWGYPTWPGTASEMPGTSCFK